MIAIPQQKGFNGSYEGPTFLIKCRSQSLLPHNEKETKSNHRAEETFTMIS